jgi:hypothetical protein
MQLTFFVHYCQLFNMNLNNFTIKAQEAIQQAFVVAHGLFPAGSPKGRPCREEVESRKVKS